MISKIHQNSSTQPGSSCSIAACSGGKTVEVVDVTVAEVTVLVVEEMLDVVIVELVVELVVVEVEDVVVVELVVVVVEVLVVELVVDDVLEVVVVVVVETMHVDSLWAMVTIAMGAKAELYENGTRSADSLMLNSTPVMSPSRFSVWFSLGYRFPTPMYWPPNGTRHRLLVSWEPIAAGSRMT